ncbi:Protein-L-isoaspartate O-methyltransferase [Actinopolyspora alba]|uniref:Protein-L-isoaspartate O-methyltransferase n=1 Tax=Actinopolyspora alba TaxID=673379 RepID=A0A1I1VWU7_9ACTN|nr:methyltransferase domain-containing protein [Actinopolyspora alba]SFD87462.1 Protein-L-isoaspartate O-methyltransferase [Actinopolyspora alba]
MTTHLDADWTWRAERLADELETRGDLTDPRWKTAVATVPRHVLVPEAYQQDTGGAWRHLATDSGKGLELAYSPTTLVTVLDERDHPLSSGTKPDLIVRMLETLDIDDEHRVLAIGTGTGYTTALLCHRLGDRNVCSVDIAPELVDDARDRLAGLGYHPELACRDGADGLPEHAPYDRVIATCSVSRVPWSWAEQLTVGGFALVNVKPTVQAGNLVLLRRYPDRLEGRFTDRWAAFMSMRHQSHDQNPPTTRTTPEDAEPRTRTTTTPPSPWWDNTVVWLLAQFHGLPDGVTIGMRLDPNTGQPAVATMTAPDGSTAEIGLTASGGGRYEVTEAGPTSLWEPVEHAHRTWLTHGKPGWTRLGITATEHEQRLWIDHPDSPSHWLL